MNMADKAEVTMRIIAGLFKRKQIEAPPGLGTRPTSDRIRESIFNIVSAETQGAKVLDLFAGSGALGIEAMSRGAESCYFVESNPESVSFVSKNLKSCNADLLQCFVRSQRVEDFLRIGKPSLVSSGDWANLRESIDLVFADPPYSSQWYAEALLSLEDSGMCKAGCLLVLEMDKERFELPKQIPNWEREDERIYGKTKVQFWRRVGSSSV